MSDKVTILLKTPMPASDDCLPHAAMTLGSVRGVGTRPTPGMVSRLIIQEQFGNWCLYRMDANGGFIGDTWHPSKEDALHTAKREFGVTEKDAATAVP